MPDIKPLTDLYDSLFSQALLKVKAVRDPNRSNPYAFDKSVKEQTFFNFGGPYYEKYTDVISSSLEISKSVLKFIIIQLFEEYNIPIQTIENSQEGSKDYEFCILDKKNNLLLVFKSLEINYMIINREGEPEVINDLLKKYKVQACKYIYYMKDKAYLQVIGHNNNTNDPGRGYNLYALKWLFETYFSTQEFTAFTKALEKYEQNVNSTLGYSIVRTLTPEALINFRKITENQVIHYSYNSIKKLIIPNYKYKLTDDEFNTIKEQFDEYFNIITGDHDFAESFVTAEWLYFSMKEAKAIDLTPIATSYFKAVEQLLCELICLHKDTNLVIKSINTKTPIDLSTDNISNLRVDFSIGSMANFFKDNLTLLKNELSPKGKAYVKEFIFMYADIRNSHLHKDNIHDWNKIENIRNNTYYILFLLIGSHIFSSLDISKLGYATSDEACDDYYKLCEYVNYHCNDLFFIDNSLYWGFADYFTKIIDNRYIKYSGAYFKSFGNNDTIIKITKDNIPDTIFLGKLSINVTNENKICVTPERIKKIVENKKFIGGLIAEEDTNY